MAKRKAATLVAAMSGMGASAEAYVGGAAIDALLGELEDQHATTGADEVIEASESNDAPAAVEATVDPALPIETEPVSGEGNEVIEGDDKTTGDAPAEAAADPEKAERERLKKEKAEKKAAEKLAREQAAAAKKAEREAAKAAKAAEAANKPAPTPRKHYADRADRIADRLGDDLPGYMVLEVADALLEGDALKAKQDETFAMIKGMNQKVKNRASLLLDYMAGKSSNLNGVIATTFRLLHTDGKITTGDEGNVIKALLARPYSLNSARAMGNNTISLLKQLKVLVENGEKQTYVANPNSLVLAKVNQMLGLTTEAK